jgi:hypothetical protein
MIDLSEVVLLSLHSPLATRSDIVVLSERTAFYFGDFRSIGIGLGLSIRIDDQPRAIERIATW